MSADFAISTEVTTKNSASPVLRQVARDVKHLAGDIKTHIGGKLSKPWASFTKGTREAIVGVTSVGGVVKGTTAVASVAIKGLGAASKVAFWGATGLVTGLTAGAAAVKSLVDDFVDVGDEIGATATKLGIGTRALQELRYAADLSDVDPKEFDAGIAALNVNLGKAKTATGKLYKELRKTADGKIVLGALLDAKGPEEAATILIETAKRIPDVTKRAALLRTALGGAGAAWLKFGETGADGVAELRKAAAAAGVLSDDQIAMAGDIDTANKRLGYSWRGLKFAIATELAPSVLDLTNRFRDYLDANRGVVAEKTADAIRAVAGWVKDAAIWLGEAYTATVDWLQNGGWESIKETIAAIVGGIKDVVTWIGKAIDVVGGLKGAFDLLVEGVIVGTLARVATGIAAISAAGVAARTGAAAQAAAIAGGATAEAAAAAGASTGSAAGAAAMTGARLIVPWLGVGYGVAKLTEGVLDKAGVNAVEAGVDQGTGRQLYEARGTETSDYSRLSTGALAKRFLEQEQQKGDYGVRTYNELQDRGVPLEMLRQLSAVSRSQRETGAFDIQGRLANQRAVNEIVVRFDGLPDGATVATTGKGPAKVTASRGFRQFWSQGQ